MFTMLFSIKNLTYLRADELTQSLAGVYRFDKKELPLLEWVSPMQRRRLSAFTKMALYCGYNAAVDDENIAVVFSSRHGDLHKTSTLLGDLAQSHSLSPTAFSMSVHNASAGLLSILTGNKASSNTVSAGRDSFFMAIVDAYAKLSSGMCDKVLIVHCEQALPDVYLPFKDERQVDHAMAFVMSKDINEGIELSLKCLPINQKNIDNNTLPQSLCFLASLQEKSLSTRILGCNKEWLVEVK